MGNFFFEASVVVFAIVGIGSVYRPFKAAAMFMEAKARYWQVQAALEEHRLKCMKDSQEKGGGA